MGTKRTPLPVSPKVISGAIASAVGLLLPAIGVYHVSVEVQGLITAAEYAGTAYLVKEEGKLYEILRKAIA